jgi:hypothetical protein
MDHPDSLVYIARRTTTRTAAPLDAEASARWSRRSSTANASTDPDERGNDGSSRHERRRVLVARW